jgi:alpha-methylacyl-CoA racemase
VRKKEITMGVLDGIKVLELARVPPAELPGMLFADMGAEVLKVETPPETPEASDVKRRAAFAYVNRNKRSLAMNLKAPEGQALFKRLAAEADVIVEGFRPGVMKRLGADYETIRALNPRIVYCSLSGFGQNGPYRDYPAHDMNYLSLAGVLNLIGEADRKPAIPLNIVADYAGASMHGALGIMFALFARERTGRGQLVDVSYLDTSVALLAATPNMRFYWSDGMAPKRGAGFLGGSYPYYAIYDTLDGKLLTIGCTEPWLWENFCKAIDRPDLARFSRKPDQFVREANAEEIRARRGAPSPACPRA